MLDNVVQPVDQPARSETGDSAYSRHREGTLDVALIVLVAIAQAEERASGASGPFAPGRVNVYEQWETEADLEAFRGAGPSEEMTAQILDAQVARHQVSSSGPA